MERCNLLKAYGARLELTPGAQGMQGAIERAEQLHRQIPQSVILGQFDNPANPAVHERTTAQEIWNDCEGTVDIFVAGAGTGRIPCWVFTVPEPTFTGETTTFCGESLSIR